MEKKLSTESYKGTRDFYPQDMAVQRYIFDTWAKTAESFGYERYDASILEPSELYKSKGAENEELVNDQTYTFIDRGDREVTLRPEMTPTVARMVAGKRRDLNLPVRWYSIPNLFRYERPQRGRLREHWQLNCDMFGVDNISADVEMISLAYNVLKAFGAQDSDFEIRINNRRLLEKICNYYSFSMHQDNSLNSLESKSDEIKSWIIGWIDRIEKKSKDTAKNELLQMLPNPEEVSEVWNLLHTNNHILWRPFGGDAYLSTDTLIKSLNDLGIENITFDPKIARGFSYYTGTIFEIFDTDPKNNRSLLGGGRYDNLTELFGGDPISGIGFGMGDVTMRDFLETHNLLEGKVPATAPTLVIIPENDALFIEGEKIAQEFRNAGIRTSVDIGTKKSDKKRVSAEKKGIEYILALTTVDSETLKLKELRTREETSGSLTALIDLILKNLKRSELSKILGEAKFSNESYT